VEKEGVLMFSIISFGNIRISGMKSPMMPYAALGVGLAIVLTVGLTAIAGVVEQPLMEGEQLTMEQETVKAPAQETVEQQADVSREESLAGPGAPTSEEKFGVMQEQEQYYMTTEPPASPFTGLLMVIPYIAAAIVGSVVFVVVRKQVGF
jgi:hypothetical protein